MCGFASSQVSPSAQDCLEGIGWSSGVECRGEECTLGKEETKVTHQRAHSPLHGQPPPASPHGHLPSCGQTQDRWGDHALSCICGGDWVCHHNAIRDVVHRVAQDNCTLYPVKEKPGLLPPRAPNDGDLHPPPDPQPPILPEATSAAPLMSGFPAAPAGRPRPVTSPLAAPFARLFGPGPTGMPDRSSSWWNTARPCTSSSVLSSSKLAGKAGLGAWGSSPPGFLTSLVGLHPPFH